MKSKSEIAQKLVDELQKRGRKVLVPELKIDNHGRLDVVYVEDSAEFDWENLGEYETRG